MPRKGYRAKPSRSGSLLTAHFSLLAFRQAFTLIEVLVVVAIIALLVAILLPSLGRARAQARMAACASNQRQIGTAMNLFATEYRERVPRGISRHGGVITSPINWVNMIARRFGDKSDYSKNFNRVPVEKYEVYSCPDRSAEYGGRFLDYVVNSLDHRGPLTDSCQPTLGGGEWYEVEGVTKLKIWKFPSEVIYVMDAVEESWNVAYGGNSWGTFRKLRENIDATRRPEPPSTTGYDWFDVPGAESFPTYRRLLGAPKPRASLKMHVRTGSNAVFVDGHVALVKPPPESTETDFIFDVQRFYLKLFGLDRSLLGKVTAWSADASLACTAGDAFWKP